ATPTNMRQGYHVQSLVQGLLDLFDLEALDDVPNLDVVVALERHAAVETFLHLAHVVLETLQTAEFAAVDLGVVAQQAHPTRTLDDAIDHHTACDVSRLADLEDLANFGLADGLFDHLGRQKAFHCSLHVVDHVVDDAVLTDLNALTLRQ